jgi:transcriptional regulator with XRE-family HTH domain
VSRTFVELGKKLKAIAERKGLSQPDIADRLGIRPQAVSYWYTGAKRPEAYRLGAVAALLDANLAELVQLGFYSSKERGGGK